PAVIAAAGRYCPAQRGERADSPGDYPGYPGRNGPPEYALSPLDGRALAGDVSASAAEWAVAGGVCLPPERCATPAAGHALSATAVLC
ncbi:hypothetical protein LOS09_21965, partial [Proteus mirabilis]|uniref:hypothetical protein n=1 Tax=Proteus mirabilis TaxID=584 RepID=UPI001E3AB611